MCSLNSRRHNPRPFESLALARLQAVALDHAWLDHAGVQGQEDDAGVEADAGLQRGGQARFHRLGQACIVGLGEALGAPACKPIT